MLDDLEMLKHEGITSFNKAVPYTLHYVRAVLNNYSTLFTLIPVLISTGLAILIAIINKQCKNVVYTWLVHNLNYFLFLSEEKIVFIKSCI